MLVQKGGINTEVNINKFVAGPQANSQMAYKLPEIISYPRMQIMWKV